MKKSLGSKTIAMPLPAWAIAAYDEQGRPNAMAAAWCGIVNSIPPSIYFSVRDSRYTHSCVLSSKAFSVNIPSSNQAAILDYLGMESGRDKDKLKAAGLTITKSAKVNAPIINEFPLTLECELSQTLELGSHLMVVGMIVDVLCDESMLGTDLKPDISKIRPFCYNTADGSYYQINELIGKGYQLGKQINGDVE